MDKKIMKTILLLYSIAVITGIGLTPRKTNAWVGVFTGGSGATGGGATSETLRPNGGDSITWSVFGAATRYEAVDEATSDGDTTYIYRSANYGYIDFNHTDTASCSGKTISKVTVHWIGKKIGASTSTVRSHGKSGSTFWVGANNELTESYAEYSDDITTDPATGLAWTCAGVDAFIAGVDARYLNTQEVRVTQVWVTVHYQ